MKDVQTSKSIANLDEENKNLLLERIFDSLIEKHPFPWKEEHTGWGSEVKDVNSNIVAKFSSSQESNNFIKNINEFKKESLDSLEEIIKEI